MGTNRLRKKRTVALSFLCLAAGCAHLHPAITAPTAAPPADTAAYYDYPRAAINPTVELLSEHEGYAIHLVRWPLATADALSEAERTVEVEWYESSQPGTRAALLVLPILGGNYPIERAFCRFFSYRGVHCALVRRRTIKFAATESPEDLEALLRRAVVRNRQVIDWLETQPSVDDARLGLFGISMGGIVGVMTAAVEPRVKALVAGLAGGSIADILCHTHDSILTRPRARYLAKQGVTLEALHRRLTDGIRTDPLRLAPYVDGHRVLTIMARLDRTIPRAERLALWRALGQPETLLLPLGHYSSIALVPYVATHALRFYRRTLGLPPTTLPRRRGWRQTGVDGIMSADPGNAP